MSFKSSQALRQSAGGFSTAMGATMVLFLIAISGVVWVYTGMIANERWPIKWLEIDGPFERVSAEQLRSSLTPLVDGSFFMVNTGLMRKVSAEMPWVSAVEVQKRWPDTVQVTIHEFTPVSHWIDGHLLDAAGRPFSVPSANELQGLPWLEGPESQLDVVFKTWKEFDDRLVLIGQHTDRLTLDPRGSWSARLSGGTEVRLGKGDIFRRLDMLTTTWAGLMRGQAVPPVSIDLRYTNGFAVMWPLETNVIAGNYGEES